MASKVFISWGGDLSKLLAEEVKKLASQCFTICKTLFYT